MDAYSYHIWRTWYNGSYTMMAKPIRALELHHPTIQFLIIFLLLSTTCKHWLRSNFTKPQRAHRYTSVWTSVYYGDIPDNELCSLNVLVAVNFCFSFVWNSLVYITIPKNNGKKWLKINWNKKLVPVCVIKWWCVK